MAKYRQGHESTSAFTRGNGETVEVVEDGRGREGGEEKERRFTEEEVAVV